MRCILLDSVHLDSNWKSGVVLGYGESYVWRAEKAERGLDYSIVGVCELIPKLFPLGLSGRH